MYTKKTGLKLKTTQFYTKTGILLLSTLIFVNIFCFNKQFTLQSNSFQKNNLFWKNFNSINFFFFNLQKNLNQFKKSDLDALSKLFLNAMGKFFKVGQILTIHGKSAGKGTAGNIKKNNFKRGPVSHGSKHVRLQGSLGSGTTPGRTLPGKKMSGLLGFKSQKTVKAKILVVNPKENLLIFNGSVPGKKNSLLLLS